MMLPPVRRLVFAAGGTAGHIEPGIAVAHEWRRRHPSDYELFIGTENGLESVLIPSAGFELKTIPKVVAPRKLTLGLFRFPADLWSAIRITRTEISGAELVIGFGGYVSAPVYLAARSLKIPIVIHEANAKVGWANYMGSLFTPYLACAHVISHGRFSKAHVTGIPLKASILQAVIDAADNWKLAREKAKKSLGWNLESPTLLVMGGSQGSTFINAEIEKALPKLIARGVQILHAVGTRNSLPSKSEGYSAVPYISDMATAFLAADIVIARSGAVTCAEFASLGKYALFIPLPVGNGEQAKNADFLVKENRARVLNQNGFSAKWLIAHFDQLLEASARASDAALDSDLGAVKKIIDVMEKALRGAIK